MSHDYTRFFLVQEGDQLLLVDSTTNKVEYQVLDRPSREGVITVQRLDGSDRHPLILSTVTNESIVKLAPEWLI
ncbi:MAG TPA: hypothetical protein PLU46_10360 [Thiotrichales bacterium]|nr:MAG: hypothetical protein B7Y29_01370 [Thiotrichales bacterium 16-46-22]OZA18257.1 MAG: hypothetical protein B7X85_04000 [Thiotrichales bacterium 17-46-47]HQT02553.1 hypothetical protein [Thiotrichales bacterium]HQT05378.1 hypothetical protein [Thiotrichales bacterium]